VPLTYHPDAEAELLDAVEFYSGSVPGLGDRFLREFDDADATILRAPDRWPIVDADIRRFVMQRFPYGIYYRVRGPIVQILVV
jgi:hypothetical protein